MLTGTYGRGVPDPASGQTPQPERRTPVRQGSAVAAQRGGVHWAPSLVPRRRLEDQGAFQPGGWTPAGAPAHLGLTEAPPTSLLLGVQAPFPVPPPPLRHLTLPPRPCPRAFSPVNRWGLSGLQVTYCFRPTSLVDPVLCVSTGRTEVFYDIP